MPRQLKNAPAPKTRPYFQIRVNESWFDPADLPADAPEPRPVRLTGRYLTSPHWHRTYICSMDPSLAVTPLDYQFEWEDYDAVPEDVRDWYNNLETEYFSSCELVEYWGWWATMRCSLDAEDDEIKFRESIQVHRMDCEIELDDDGKDITDEGVEEYSRGNHYI